MVAEACQESGTVFTGNTYNGYGDIFHKEIAGSPKESLCDITPPWTGTPITDEVLTEDIPETYSSGTERYVVTMHDGFIGETASAEFTECWYTDDGNRYVKTTGSNSALGNNWANAWLTTGYGFQNIPSGKDLYIEEGLYGGETLSNINPPQTTSVYIQPSGHTESTCTVAINNTDVFTDSSFNTGTWALNTEDFTWIFPSQTITFDGTLQFFDIEAYGSTTGTFTLKIFRDVGSNYNYIGESPAYSVSGDGIYYFAPCSINVEVGDIIGFKSTGDTNIRGDPNSNTCYFKSGNVGSDSLKSSWTSATYDVSAEVHGFKST